MGQLMGYNETTGKVTVRQVGGRVMTFSLTHLHPDDHEYVKSRAE